MAMTVFSQIDQHNRKGVVTGYVFQNVRASIGSIRDPKGLRATRRNFSKSASCESFYMPRSSNIQSSNSSDP